MNAFPLYTKSIDFIKFMTKLNCMQSINKKEGQKTSEKVTETFGTSLALTWSLSFVLAIQKHAILDNLMRKLFKHSGHSVNRNGKRLSMNYYLRSCDPSSMDTFRETGYRNKNVRFRILYQVCCLERSISFRIRFGDFMAPKEV